MVWMSRGQSVPQLALTQECHEVGQMQEPRGKPGNCMCSQVTKSSGGSPLPWGPPSGLRRECAAGQVSSTAECPSSQASVSPINTLLHPVPIFLFFYIYINLFIFIFYLFIHMCIHCLGNFSPPTSAPSFPPPPPPCATLSKISHQDVLGRKGKEMRAGPALLLLQNSVRLSY
jgi:hypothetical protein